MQEDGEKTFEIEKMSDIKKLAEQPDIVFDNSGNMHTNNREYRRDMKRVWRSVTEGRKLRFFTKKHKTSTKASKKRERQNRKKGRK